jgi:hypothetical protein
VRDASRLASREAEPAEGRDDREPEDHDAERAQRDIPGQLNIVRVKG